MFEKEQCTYKRRNRGRNIIWHNPPFSKNVKTNIAKQFLYLLGKHFGRNHKYHKIFKRNNVKISYSCMDNMTNVISSHNKKITNSYNETNCKTCNCRNKRNCPLDNKCLKPTMVSMIYQRDISEIKFKSRTHENDNKLSKYIWS